MSKIFAKKTTQNSRQEPPAFTPVTPPKQESFGARQTPPKPLWALFSGLCGLLLCIALFDYAPYNNPLLTTAAETQTQMGKLGLSVAFQLFTWIGFAAWTLPFFIFGITYTLSSTLSHTLEKQKLWATALFILSCASLSAWVETYLLPQNFLNQYYPNTFIQGLGGFVGFLIFNTLLSDNLGSLGSLLILISCWGLSLCGLFKGTPILNTLKNHIKNAFIRSTATPEAILNIPALPPEPVKVRKSTKKIAEDSTIIATPSPPPPVKKLLQEKEAVAASGLKIVSSEPTQKAIDFLPTQKGNYSFPPLNLLNPPPPPIEHHVEDHQETAHALLRVLSEFGIKVTLGEIHTGPVITRYEVTPAPGVRVEKIAALDKNIALGLCATSVRILAPVPGKGTVGVEIPNKNASPVCLREIIESTAWAHSKADIPIVLGKDVTGKPIVTDLTKMPHMLIAGSTGSGKTVCMNAVIASLLYHASPEDLRFIMVDPKIVEMQLYNSLPHMLIPVVTNPKLVPGALKWLIGEMERRYQLFAQAGVRNIAGFNAKILKDKTEEKKAAEMDSELSPEERAALISIEVPRDINLEMPGKKLPYIICLIDELADLMMVAPADIETCIARLAQLARAAGIHLILATQRPSVNVITGVIKANLPCRIAFKVASKIDSRTILDMGGADSLIGRGDMLFTPPGTAHLVRAQGAFVSDDEINGIVDFLKRNGPPQFVEEIQREVENSAKEKNSDNEEDSDELIPAAIKVLYATQRASTSILQRKLSIGYNRAARIMEILEDRGIVGPENGAKPREILKDLNTLISN